eukprot:scaffold6416_cov111-Skeletonema_marinoi.AAC.6
MDPRNGGRRRVAAVLLLPLQCMLPCWAFSPGGVAQFGGFRQAKTTPSLSNSKRWQNYRSTSKTVLMAKKTQPAPLPTTDDPFLLLGLDSRNPTTDKQEIKRAYRKRAMQYHPDVLLDQDSTAAEREQASKNFARINAAYEMLTGGTKGSASSDSSTSAKTTSGGYNYQPPHRRSSSYSSSSSSTRSTNWEDFMPNYNDEDQKYDAGGDSFGSIFSDLLTGAAGAAAGVAGSSRGGGIFGDFIDFLEGNIDGFESGYDDDRSLSELLNYGSFDDIANEMDETDVLVTSLETKQKSVENDLVQIQADLNLATKFSEKLDLEERIAELKAREKVVKGYLKKGRNRLVRLRERYKELMVEGRGGRGYGSRSSSSQSSASSSSSSYSSSSSGPSSSYRAPNPTTQPPPSPSPPPPAPSSSTSSDKNWRSEGFSSSYGRSSSGRRSSRGNRRRSAGVDEPSESTATNQQQQSNQQQQRPASETYSNRSSSTSNSSSSGSSTSLPPKQYEPWVPPHRRTTSSAEAAAQDKKRLRELQVDDEFEKLKREMGM